MTIFETYSKLESKKLILSVLFFSTAICPGVLAIWIYDPGLLNSTSATKLILLSISFMFPISILNTIFFISAYKLISKDDIDPFISIIFAGSFVTLFQSIICLGISFIFQFSLLTFCFLMLGSGILLSVVFSNTLFKLKIRPTV